MLEFLLLSSFVFDALDSSSQDRKRPALEEIIVTAQKRGIESLLDVPLTVSVLRGDDLDLRVSGTVLDALQVAPAVAVQRNDLFPGQISLQMRGVSSFFGSAVVGYYVDELPISLLNFGVLPNPPSFDLDRIEVLAGPQGSIYGANAMAGVIRILTKDPNLGVFEGRGRVSASTTMSGGNNESAEGAANIPFGDDWALRVTGGYNNREGWVDVPGLGKDLNSSDADQIRVKILGRPNDRLAIRAMYWDTSTSYQELGLANEQGENSLPIRSFGETNADYANLTIEYDFEKMSLISSTSHYDQLQVGTVIGLNILFDNKASFQELRLRSTTDGPVQWVVGTAFLDAEEDGTTGGARQIDEVESWAIFADLGYDFSSQWSSSIGLRISEETRKTRVDEEVDNDFDSVTPRLSVAFRPREDRLIYFNAAQGYRGGLNQFPFTLSVAEDLGITIPEAVEEEDLWSYELGFRHIAKEGRLLFEAAGYYYDWDNLQQRLGLPGATAVVNSGRARIPGVDLALKYRTKNDLSLALSLGWNDGELAENVFFEQVQNDGSVTEELLFRNGQRINNVPQWTISANASYAWPVFTRWQGRAWISAQYTSDRINEGFGSARSDNIVRVDGRLGVTGNAWGVFLYAENLNNEDGIIFPWPFGIAPRLRPRTVGISLEYGF